MKSCSHPVTQDMKTKILLSHKPVSVFEDPVTPAVTPKVSGEVTECGCLCHQQTEEDKMVDYMTGGGW